MRNFHKLCKVLTGLQNQAFKVNSKMFHFLKDNMHILADAGLMMPSFLARVNADKVYELLREELTSDKEKKGKENRNTSDSNVSK